MSGVYSRIVFIFVMLVAQSAVPATGAGHHAAGVPWSLIFAQTFNFLLFMGILIFLIKKFALPVFPKYRAQFLEDSTKAQKVIADAEKQKKEIEARLQKLETTYSSRMDKAKKESLELKDNLIKEAQDRAEKMQRDASDNALSLFKSSERQFKMSILDQAIDKAKKDLSKSIDEKQLQRLHGEFLEEIRVNL